MLSTLGCFPSAAEDAQFKTVDGLAVYLGVVPAAIVKGHPSGHAEQTMHGGVPAGRNEYHIVVAVFDVVTSERVSDAIVRAEVSGLGLAGPRKTLEPMTIAQTITYGGFFDLPGRDIYTVELEIQRPDTKPVAVNFTYENVFRDTWNTGHVLKQAVQGGRGLIS
jgi:hypothetical protein